MKANRHLKILFCTLLSIISTALIIISLFYRIDTLTLWSVLPGTAGTKEVREAMNTMVIIAEELPEDENARNMITSTLFLGTVSFAAGTAQKSDNDAQIMSQYTLGLVKAAILHDQGDLSGIEYQTLKLPFKLGNAAIMKRMLPVLQRRTQLPEGFMSEEEIREEQEEKQKDKKSYTTTARRTKFHWSEADVIEVTYGGMMAPATYIKPNPSDFIFPHSSERRLTVEEVQAGRVSAGGISGGRIFGDGAL